MTWKKEHIAIKALLLTIAFFLFFLISVYSASAGIETTQQTTTTALGITNNLASLDSSHFSYNGSYWLLGYVQFGGNVHFRLCALNQSYVISNMSVCQDKDWGVISSIPKSITISSDGLSIVELNSTSLVKYSLTSPYNLTGISYQYSKSLTGTWNSMSFLYDTGTGEGIGLVLGNVTTMARYVLSPAYDVRTIYDIANIIKPEFLNLNGLYQNATAIRSKIVSFGTNQFYYIENGTDILELTGLGGSINSTQTHLSLTATNSTSNLWGTSTKKLWDIASRNMIIDFSSGITTPSLKLYDISPLRYSYNSFGTRNFCEFDNPTFFLINNSAYTFRMDNCFSSADSYNITTDFLLNTGLGENKTYIDAQLQNIFNINFLTKNLTISSYSTPFNTTEILTACNIFSYSSDVLCSNKGTSFQSISIAECQNNANCNNYYLFGSNTTSINITNQTGVAGQFGGAVTALNGLFPSSSELTSTQKFAYVFISILIVTLMIFLLGSETASTHPHLTGYVALAINALFFFYFVSIGYVSIFVVVIIALLATAIVLLRIRHA